MSTSDSVLNLVVTGGAGFIGSNLVLALQEKFPDARLTVIDDFRSGDFKNLVGYRGDFVAQNLATLDWQDQFGGEKFDAIFHFGPGNEEIRAVQKERGLRGAIQWYEHK